MNGRSLSQNEIFDRLQDLIQKEVRGFNPEEPLKAQIDSLAMLSLLTLIEREYQVRFFTVELASDRWQSLDSIAALIKEKCDCQSP